MADAQKVRLATASDLTQVVELLGQLSPLNGAWPRHRLELLLDEILHDDKHHLFVYDVGGKIVGEGMVMIRLNLSHGGRAVAYAENIVVDQSYRGQGIGAQLMAKIAETAKKHHCYKLLLDCSEQNVPFYQKLGFEITFEKNMRMDF